MAIRDFNLLVSTSRGNENNACSEMWFLLGEIGDKEALVDKTNIMGLIVAKTVLVPYNVIDDLRKFLNERPEEFRYILRVIPIETVVRTDLDEIRMAVARLSPKILKNETFRVTIEKRHSQLSTSSIIEAAAANIQRKVDLENPDKIVLVEILGKLTGVSVVRPADILSIRKGKPAYASPV